MAFCSIQEIETQAVEIHSVLSDLLGRNVTSLDDIGGGRNSKVYKLTCERSEQYAAKLYFRHSLDPRDRLETEFSSLKFLWENAVRCIPRPIAVDRDRGWAIYEYIDGKKISSEEVTNSDVDYATQFIGKLKELKTREGSSDLPVASEACFTFQGVVNNIEQRMNRLSTLSNGKLEYRELRDFLTDDFRPSLDVIESWCVSSLNESGISFVDPLGYQEKTLSPSDFGFHNALRRTDGQIVFVDFEYFGWDDPAKLISDFLLHPAMRLRECVKKRFVAKILSLFEDHMHLAKRVEVIYPLFGLKWCLILLNEFIPADLLRRRYASRIAHDIGQLQARQLSKARRMLEKVKGEYEFFPYHC